MSETSDQTDEQAQGDLGTKILLVDDDATFRDRLARAFRDREFEVECAADYDEAMRTAAELMPDLAVIDLRMPGRSGVEVVRDLQESHPDLQSLVLTGYGSIATALDAVRAGAVDYLTKPADADQILLAFQKGGNGAVDEEEDEVSGSLDTAPSLGRVEWEHIQRVLQDCGGNISKAARVLNIHRRTLQRKLANFPPYR